MAARRKQSGVRGPGSGAGKRSSSNNGPLVLFLGTGAALFWFLTAKKANAAVLPSPSPYYPAPSSLPYSSPTPIPTSTSTSTSHSTSPSPNAADPDPTAPLLKQGMKSAAVGLWQTKLNRVSASWPGSKLTVDSDFGPATAAATKQLQAKMGLTQDGVVGPLTRSAAVRAGIWAAPFTTP